MKQKYKTTEDYKDKCRLIAKILLKGHDEGYAIALIKNYRCLNRLKRGVFRSSFKKNDN